MSKWQLRAARLILIMIFLVSVLAAAENVVVESDPKVIGPHLRVTVLLHGQPIKDVKLSVYSTGNELKFMRLSNAHGIVNSPRLQPGIYRIEAQFSNDVVCGTTVKVVKNARTNKLDVDLTPEFDAYQAWLEAAEKLPIAATVKEFSGAVIDPSSAPIPNAEIRVVRRGMEYATKVVLQLKSDEIGRFSAQLEPGEYIAFVSESGFKTRIFPFAVTKQGEGTVRVVLDIGAVTENVMVSANSIH